MAGFGRKQIKDWIYAIKSEEHQQILNECGCEDLDNEPLYDNLNPEQTGADWNKDELYNHFDEDGDGTVSMNDYADHIAHHHQNPDLTMPYETIKADSMPAARCPGSYEKSGDVLISIPHEIVDLLKPLMQQIGVGCPASLARAMADVLDVAMEEEVVSPFSTNRDY